MKKNHTGRVLIIFFIVVTAVFIVSIVKTYRDSQYCKVEGCNAYRWKESEYCYFHMPDHEVEAPGYNSEESNASKSSGSSKQKIGSSSSSSSSSYKSYDEGYDSIYMDEEYDEDRYSRDSEYATGVDDAMEDMDEDW